MRVRQVWFTWLAEVNRRVDGVFKSLSMFTFRYKCAFAECMYMCIPVNPLKITICPFMSLFGGIISS